MRIGWRILAAATTIAALAGFAEWLELGMPKSQITIFPNEPMPKSSVTIKPNEPSNSPKTAQPQREAPIAVPRQGEPSVKPDEPRQSE
jgi:hypothetical protein